VKVLSSVSDRTAGARAFDYNLVSHFAAEIKVAIDSLVYMLTKLLTAKMRY